MREPTNEEQRLMAVGQFDTLEEYLAWMNTPLTEEELHKLEEPDWEEIVLREMGCFDSGHGDDNNPDVLAYLQQQAEWWLEEDAEMKARKQTAAPVVSETVLIQATCVPRIPLPKQGHRSRRWHRSVW
jgi:hypothetical protein